MSTKRSVVDWVFIGSLLVIFGGIVLHAPFSVGLSTLFPDASFVVKSWKEIMMGVALLAGAVVLTRRQQWGLLNDRLILLIALFGLINLISIPLFYTGFEPTIAGLFINLRFLLFFVLVYIALRLYPGLYRLFLQVFCAGALVVVGFAVLQVAVLPNDLLKYLGYGPSTIMPYLTVDQNEAYVRINSTLRGPNPLGAYAAIVLGVVMAAWLARPQRFTRREAILAGVLAAGAIIALWASYSRSAAIAAAVAIGVIALVVYGKKVKTWMWVALAAAALAVAGSVVVFRETTFVSQVILHEDPNEIGEVNSNDGHIDSLADGTWRMITQPFGAGIGSTGSASLLTENPVIIENHYLFVAHETGWLGLGVFVAIIGITLGRLWQRRRHWLALGVFASGLGLALAALVLPVWVDDTVSIIWWGLAAVALAVPVVQLKHKGKTSS